MFEFAIQIENGTSVPVYCGKFDNPVEADELLANLSEIFAVAFDLPRKVLVTGDAQSIFWVLNELGNQGVAVDLCLQQSPRFADLVINALGESSDRNSLVWGPGVHMVTCQGKALTTMFDPAGKYAGRVGAVVLCTGKDTRLEEAMLAVAAAFISNVRGSYPEIDADAEFFQKSHGGTVDNSALSWTAELLSNGLMIARLFSPQPDKALVEFCAKYFSSLANQDCLELLGKWAVSNEEAVRLASTAQEFQNGVLAVDARAPKRLAPYNLHSLVHQLGLDPRKPALTVIFEDVGPIAAVHGEQITLTVPAKWREYIKIQEFLPRCFSSSAESGIICNDSVQAMVSRKVWEEKVLPTLERFPYTA